MSRERWYAIERSKGFYVRTYHWVILALLVSCVVNIGLLLLIGYAQLSQSEPNFYASSGESMPIELTPMDQPNYGAVALLSKDEP